jgi:hypothetical protein
MQITRPDLVSLRAKMDPADKRIADYAGENNVRKFREIVDKSRKALFSGGWPLEENSTITFLGGFR